MPDGPHMPSMRILLAAAAIASIAGSAAAQPPDYDALRAQQQLSQQRAVEQANQLMTLEARLRAEQAISDLQFARALPARVPELPYPSSVPPAPLDVSKLPSIPDAALAASNQRVQDAVRNRR